MRSNQKLIFFLSWVLITLLSASSCNWIESPDDKVIDIDEEFNVVVQETFTEFGRDIQLHIETIRPYHCADAYIAADEMVDGKHLDVAINGIIEAVPCMGLGKVLETEVNFGQLVEGNYQLNISLQNVVDNSGSLILNEASMLLDFNSPKGFVIIPAEVYRVPENTLWGFASSNENDFNGTLINFVTDLSLLCQPIVMKPGPYSGFEVEESGNLVFNAPNTSTNIHTFYFKFTGTESDLIDLLADYRQQSAGKAEFVVFSTNGKIY